jgi:HEAT repeat protein
VKPNKLRAAIILILLASAGTQAQSAAQSAAQNAERDRQKAELAAVAARRAEGEAQRQALEADRHAREAARDADRDAREAARDADRDARDRTPLSERDQLAIAALEGLMSADDARALPILQRVLKGDNSDVVKERALFVLSQIELPEAQATLMDFVRNGTGRLQREAVRMVGIGGDAKVLDELLPIYKTADRRMRKYIMEAYLIADRKDLMLAIAKGAKDEAEGDEAIQMLAAMGAVKELRSLGADGHNSRSLIQAYAIAGDLEGLRRIAVSATDATQREEAIRSMGMIGGDKAHAALREAYAKADSDRLRDAALQGMLISDDQQGVLALYRAAKTVQEKKTLLRTLSMMGGDAALDAIDAALEGKTP